MVPGDGAKMDGIDGALVCLDASVKERRLPRQI
jgi:hypothetical protein